MVLFYCDHWYDVISIAGYDEDQKYIDVRMNAIKRKILILSGKGGQLYNTIVIIAAHHV